MITVAEINTNQGIHLEQADLSLLGPVIVDQWQQRNNGKPLPPKGAGGRRYPPEDAPWIAELLRKSPDERNEMVLDVRQRTAAKQKADQLAANAGAAPVPPAAAAAAPAAAGQPPTMATASGAQVFCDACNAWKAEEAFSKKSKKENLCLECANKARFTCYFCERDYADEIGVHHSPLFVGQALSSLLGCGCSGPTASLRRRTVRPSTAPCATTAWAICTASARRTRQRQQRRRRSRRKRWRPSSRRRQPRGERAGAIGSSWLALLGSSLMRHSAEALSRLVSARLRS